MCAFKLLHLYVLISVFLWVERRRTQPRIWEGISVGHLLVNTFVITSRQRDYTVPVLLCSLTPSDSHGVLWDSLSLPECGDRGDRGAAKATCRVWGESCISCLMVQRGNWLRFIRRKYAEFELQCECILLPLLHVTLPLKSLGSVIKKIKMFLKDVSCDWLI